MFQAIQTRNKEIMDVQSCFLSTSLQIGCYCGHVIKSRAMRHLNFDTQLNLSKSYKGLVIISSVVLAQCRKVWFEGGRNPPCEIGLKLFTSCSPVNILKQCCFKSLPTFRHYSRYLPSNMLQKSVRLSKQIFS